VRKPRFCSNVLLFAAPDAILQIFYAVNRATENAGVENAGVAAMERQSNTKGS